MANLRKLLAHDLIKGRLRQSAVGEVSEMPVDRIGALGFAGLKDPLGPLLWRLRWSNDHTAFEPALDELAARCRNRRLRASQVRDVCRIVIEEWLDDVCRKCGGRTFTINQGVQHACGACNSTGTRRHSDVERMRRMGLDKRRYVRAEETFAEAHMKLADADSATSHSLAIQLERLTGKAGTREQVLALLSLPSGILEVGAVPAHNQNNTPDSAAAAHPAHNQNNTLGCRESR